MQIVFSSYPSKKDLSTNSYRHYYPDSTLIENRNQFNGRIKFDKINDDNKQDNELYPRDKSTVLNKSLLPRGKPTLVMMLN